MIARAAPGSRGAIPAPQTLAGPPGQRARSCASAPKKLRAAPPSERRASPHRVRNERRSPRSPSEKWSTGLVTGDDPGTSQATCTSIDEGRQTLDAYITTSEPPGAFPVEDRPLDRANPAPRAAFDWRWLLKDGSMHSILGRNDTKASLHRRPMLASGASRRLLPKCGRGGSPPRTCRCTTSTNAGGGVVFHRLFATGRAIGRGGDRARRKAFGETGRAGPPGEYHPRLPTSYLLGEDLASGPAPGRSGRGAERAPRRCAVGRGACRRARGADPGKRRSERTPYARYEKANAAGGHDESRSRSKGRAQPWATVDGASRSRRLGASSRSRARPSMPNGRNGHEAYGAQLPFWAVTRPTEHRAVVPGLKTSSRSQNESS